MTHPQGSGTLAVLEAIPDGFEQARRSSIAVTSEWVRGWNACRLIAATLPLAGQGESASPIPISHEEAWMPIETAPKDGTGIIVVSDTGNVWCHVRWEIMKRKEDRWTSFLGPIPFKPTHWRPIPAPPSTPGDKNG